MSTHGQNFWGGLVTVLRVENGMSQRSLCVNADVPRSTLRSIEKGESVPDVLTLERILQVFDYELDVFSQKALIVRVAEKPSQKAEQSLR